MLRFTSKHSMILFSFLFFCPFFSPISFPLLSFAFLHVKSINLTRVCCFNVLQGIKRQCAKNSRCYQECTETRVIKSKRYSICTMHRKPSVLQLLVQMRYENNWLFKYNVVGRHDYNYGIKLNEINQIRWNQIKFFPQGRNRGYNWWNYKCKLIN